MPGLSRFAWLQNALDRSMEPSTVTNEPKTSLLGLTACHVYDANLNDSAQALVSNVPSTAGSSECGPEHFRSVSGSTCVSESCVATPKREDSPSLQVVKYRSSQPASNEGHSTGLEPPQTCSAKDYRDRILQLELSHLVQVNDLKSLLACREMVHKKEVEDLEEAHRLQFATAEREAQATTTLALRNALAFYDDTLTAIATEQQKTIETIQSNCKMDIQRSRLSTLEVVHKLADLRETDQTLLTDSQRETMAAKSALIDLKAKYEAKMNKVCGETESLKVALQNTNQKHEREMALAQDECQEANSVLEEVKKQSGQQLHLAQVTCQNANTAFEEAKQSFEQQLHFAGEELQRQTATVKVAEERLTVVEARCQEEESIKKDLRDNLQKLEIEKDSQIEEARDAERKLSERIDSLQSDNGELRAKSDLLEQIALSFREEQPEENIGTTSTKSASQDCVLCPKKSKNLRKVRSVNKILATKLTDAESTVAKLEAQLVSCKAKAEAISNEEKVALQKLLGQKEAQIVALQAEGESQVAKLSKWIKDLVLANNDAKAEAESQAKMVMLKDVKIDSMMSDAEEVTDLRLRYAALIESTADNLSRKEPNLHVDCKYMVDQITLMTEFSNAVEDLYAQEMNKSSSAEKQRDEALRVAALANKRLDEQWRYCNALEMEFQDTKQRLSISEATHEGHADRQQCEAKLLEKTAMIEQLQKTTQEFQERLVNLEHYTICYQTVKAAIEHDEAAESKRAAHDARWSKVMLEEIAARFETKKVQELQKEVAKKVARLEGQQNAEAKRMRAAWSS